MVGNRIRERRKAKGLTQKQLAAKVNVSSQVISNWEREYTSPDHDDVAKLAEALDTSSDYLLGLTDDPTPPIMSDTRVKRIVGELAQPVLDDDALECLDQLHKRPEMKTLFQVSKNATKEDIETAITIIEALRKKKED